MTANSAVKRLGDLAAAAVLAVALTPVTLTVAAVVKLTSPGPVLYWSKRVGRHNQLFDMPKFRTMRVGTPAVATHKLIDSGGYLTPVGGWLRRFSLDEIPQLWSIMRGEMSFVGPRPALFNQDDLIAQRREAHVDQLTPGLTGWAQINGRDSLSIPEKVEFDVLYARRQSIGFDIYILALTAVKVLRREGVRH